MPLPRIECIGSQGGCLRLSRNNSYNGRFRSDLLADRELFPDETFIYFEPGFPISLPFRSARRNPRKRGALTNVYLPGSTRTVDSSRDSQLLSRGFESAGGT